MPIASILFFPLWKNSKTTTLTGLYAEKSPTRRRLVGIANLHADSNTADSNGPIILGNYTVNVDCSILTVGWSNCHDPKRFMIYRIKGRLRMKLTDKVARLHLKLAFPLTHILCVFADDLRASTPYAQNLEVILHLAAGMIETGARCRPHLVTDH